MLATEFLVRGATQFREPGVFISFEETAADLTQNVASMGFDLEALQSQKKLVIDEVRIAPGEIHETGEYDLDAFSATRSTRFAPWGETRRARYDRGAVWRLFECRVPGRGSGGSFFGLLEKKVTAVITGERGDGQLTRQGLEEYVSDCVMLLDHRVANQLTIRRLRIVKYRGSTHGTDEYPFLIGETGISVLPITSLGMSHRASNEKISSGIPQLDAALGGGGFFRGSTILVSGLAGTGKSTFAGHYVAAAGDRGERSLYVALEQSPDEFVRNMRLIGVPLGQLVRNGVLRFHALRPTAHGLELHLTTIHQLVEELRPRVVVVDAITSFLGMGISAEVTSMVVRLIDFLKSRQITLYMTSLNEDGQTVDRAGANISSVVDTWLSLRNVERNGARARTLSIVKGRGLAHSSVTQEFSITSKGVALKTPTSQASS